MIKRYFFIFFVSFFLLPSNTLFSQKIEGKRQVALTFDDGPSPHTTPGILAVLKQYNIKATFFMLGNQIQHYPELVKKVIQEGHSVGNHSYSHPILPRKSPFEVQQELEKTYHLLTALGVHPHWFRPPYGRTSATVRAASSKLGMTEVLWTIDSEDWKDSRHIIDHVQKNLKSGGIILMHDTKQATLRLLPSVITLLKQQGYTFVTLDQLKQPL